NAASAARRSVCHDTKHDALCRGGHKRARAHQRNSFFCARREECKDVSRMRRRASLNFLSGWPERLRGADWLLQSGLGPRGSAWSGRLCGSVLVAALFSLCVSCSGRQQGKASGEAGAEPVATATTPPPAKAAAEPPLDQPIPLWAEGKVQSQV